MGGGESSPRILKGFNLNLSSCRSGSAEEAGGVEGHLRQLPDRAEEEIMRIRYLSLKNRVTEYEKDAKGCFMQRPVKRERTNSDEIWPRRLERNSRSAIRKRRRSNGDVWFTTLAEVQLEKNADLERGEDGNREPQGSDLWAVDELFMGCLREMEE